MVIFSDSLSALQSIKLQKDENFVIEILILCTNLSFKGTQVYFEWIPSHCGIPGNEVADQAAKHALKNPCIEISNKLNRKEFNCQIRKYCYNKWQLKWDVTDSPLKKVQQNVCKTYYCSPTMNNRRAESIIHGLRMGNLGLNENLFKMKKHESGLCENCAVPETVEHFLIHCPKYIIARSLLLAETETQEDDMLSILSSMDIFHQKAFVNFVLRLQRFLYS